jgi:hypothetical protein
MISFVFSSWIINEFLSARVCISDTDRLLMFYLVLRICFELSLKPLSNYQDESWERRVCMRIFSTLVKALITGLPQSLQSSLLNCHSSFPQLKTTSHYATRRRSRMMKRHQSDLLHFKFRHHVTTVDTLPPPPWGRVMYSNTPPLLRPLLHVALQTLNLIQAMTLRLSFQVV